MRSGLVATLGLVVSASLLAACADSDGVTDKGSSGVKSGDAGDASTAETGGASSGGSTSTGGQSSGGSTAAGGGPTSTGGANDAGTGGATSSGGTTADSVDAAMPSGACGTRSCGQWTRDYLWASCCREDGGPCGWTITNLVPFIDGLYSVCEDFEQPGEKDAACPDVNVYFSAAHQLLATFPGCCRPDGRCGAVMHATSGCVAHEDLDRTGIACTPK